VTITIGQSFVFEITPLFISMGRYELFWNHEEFVFDRPNGSSWHWRKGHGRWTQKDGGIMDGWVRE
jgi:hypothetical protein